MVDVPPPYAAYLRVYEPLAAFSPAERERWRSYAAAGAAPDRTQGPRVEHVAALQRLLCTSQTDADEQAFVLQSGATTLVCPWRTRLRSWESVVSVREGMPEVVADAFVPRPVADATRAEAAAWQAANPVARTHIRSQTWSVPVRWFVLFTVAERRVETADGEVAVSYQASMADARRRAARALAVLRRSAGEQAVVTEAVEEQARWLEEFHPHSVVELDYGGLAGLLTRRQLAEDRSTEDVAAALAALARSDSEAAATAYQRVAERWRRVQLTENAN